MVKITNVTLNFGSIIYLFLKVTELCTYLHKTNFKLENKMKTANKQINGQNHHNIYVVNEEKKIYRRWTKPLKIKVNCNVCYYLNKKSTKKLSKSIKSNQTMQVIIQKSDRACIHIFFMEFAQAKCIQLRIYSQFLKMRTERKREKHAFISVGS